MRLEQIDQFRWRLPREGGMRVDGIVYADERLMADIRDDPSLTQVQNVAHLPGIVGASLAMPDIHWGYGFPIGGVAAMDADEGVVSPGGVGYDINCGVRLLRSRLTREEVAPRMREIVGELFSSVPTGRRQGARRPEPRRRTTSTRVLQDGAAWAVRRGLGTPADLDHIEEGGRLPDADPGLVSDARAERGRTQLGTLGSGNHFAEIQYVAEIYDERVAERFGLRRDQVTVMIHSGSRGLGHQVCDDHLRVMIAATRKYGIELPDRQLCCAPLGSPEGQRYLAAMAAAANFAFANRQVMTHWARESLTRALGVSHAAGGHRDALRRLSQHREVRDLRARRPDAPRCASIGRAPRGPTRPGTRRRPAAYRDVGQPVHHPRRHGALLLRAGGHRARPRRHVRVVVPRRRPPVEPIRREAHVHRPRGDGRSRRPRGRAEGRRHGHRRRGDAAGLQGRRGGRRGDGRRGNLDAGGPAAAARRHKRVIIEPL